MHGCVIPRLVEGQRDILDLLLFEMQRHFTPLDFVILLLNLTLQFANRPVIRLFLVGNLRHLLPESANLLLLLFDLLLLLLELVVEVVFQHGMLLNEALLVADLAVVLRLAGEVHFLYLVLQLLKHQIRSIPLLVSFLSTCDFDFGYLLGQLGDRLLLRGDEGAVQDFLDTALDVRLRHVALCHLDQAIGVTG